MTLTRLLCIPELVVHCLAYLPPSKYNDTSVKTLLACTETCRSLREIAKTDILWGPHYRVRYLRDQGYEGEWYTHYTFRRKADLQAINLLNDIISNPSKRDESIVQLVEMGDLVWDVLNMEAMCRVPDELKDVWAREDRERRTERWEGIGEEWNRSFGEMDGIVPEDPDTRNIEDDWIQRRWWAKQALGTMARASAVHAMSKVFTDPRPDPVSPENARVFEEGIKALSGLMGANVAEIGHNYDNLARACGLHLESVGISTDSRSSEFDLKAFSVGVCNWMASQGFKKARDDRYYDLMNHFPHKFMTTNRPTLPMSLVYTFVAIVTRLGLRASPVGFPGHVHAWIALPDSGPGWEDGSLAVDVFRSDQEPFLSDQVLKEKLQLLVIPEAQWRDLLGPAEAAEMVFRAANNILHSVTRVQNQMDLSVSPETRAAALYASATTFLISRPEAADASRFVGGIMSVVKEYFPLDTEPVLARALAQLLTRDPHQSIGFQLRNVVAKLKQNYVEVNGRGSVKWWVGLVFRHAKFGYIGLVTSWDKECRASEEWIQGVGVNQLPRGRHQPFYSVVGEDGSTRYVAEENIIPLPAVPKDGEEQDRVTWADVHELVANSTWTIEQTFSRIEVNEEQGPNHPHFKDGNKVAIYLDKLALSGTLRGISHVNLGELAILQGDPTRGLISRVLWRSLAETSPEISGDLRSALKLSPHMGEFDYVGDVGAAGQAGGVKDSQERAGGEARKADPCSGGKKSRKKDKLRQTKRIPFVIPSHSTEDALFATEGWISPLKLTEILFAAGTVMRYRESDKETPKSVLKKFNYFAGETNPQALVTQELKALSELEAKEPSDQIEVSIPQRLLLLARSRAN